MAKKDHKAQLAASVKAAQDSSSQSVSDFSQRLVQKMANAEALIDKQQALPPSTEPAPTIRPACHVSQPGRQGEIEPVIRDAFTFPKADYDLIAGIRRRCLADGLAVTKSDVLRAGLQVLNKMPASHAPPGDPGTHGRENRAP
jgi:hypothetical protein